MAEIERKVQKIFGGSLSANGNISKYGSKEEGAVEYSLDLDEIQTPRWLNGLLGAVSIDKAPYLQDLNALFYVMTKQLAYLFQAGIAEWNAETEYFANKSFVLYNGEVYKAIANSVNQEPTNSSYWVMVSNYPVVSKSYSSTIALENNKINVVTLTGNVTFSLPTPANTGILNQIEVQLYMASARTINLGTSNYFNNTVPDFSSSGYYNLYYEYDNIKQQWVVGAIYKGA